MNIIETAVDFFVFPWWHAMVFIGAVSSVLIIFCLVCMYLEKRGII